MMEFRWPGSISECYVHRMESMKREKEENKGERIVIGQRSRIQRFS